MTTANQWTTRLLASADAPANGKLTSDAHFDITLGGSTPVSIIVAADNTNVTMDDLVADLNSAISSTRLSGNVVASHQGDRIILSANGFSKLRVSSLAGDSATTILHLGGQSANAAIGYTTNTVFDQKLAPLLTFRTEQFTDAVQRILGLFDQQLSHLTTPIPMLNQSLDDVLGVSQKLKNSILSLQGKAGVPLKLATQGIVNNLRIALLGLPNTLPAGASDDLNRLFESLRVAAQNAERTDIALPVNLASVIVAGINPLTAAIAKINKPGVDMTPFNAVLTQLQSVTPSLLQLPSTFSTTLGVGSTTGQFMNANPTAFEQSLVIHSSWAPNTTRSMPLSSLKLPNGLGPLKFGAGSAVNLATVGDFKFDFGFNMTTGLPFLLDTSRFSATASLNSVAQTYPATIGGVSVTLGNPSAPVSMKLQTSANAVPASLQVILTPTSHTTDIGNIPFALVPGHMNYAGVNGQLSSVLPVYVLGNFQGNVTVAWTVPSSPSSAGPTVTAPANLIPLLQSLPYNFAVLTDGINEWNSQFEQIVAQKIIAKFPLVANDINIDAGFIGTLKDQFLSSVQAAIAANGGVDSNAFRTSLFNFVQTSLGSLLVPTTLRVPVTGSPEVSFTIAGHDVYHSGLDVGLPGLDFATFEPGKVDIDLNYNLRLGFGISKTEGFYFIVDRLPTDINGPQFTLNVAAALDKASSIKSNLLSLPTVAQTNVDASNHSLTKAAPADILVRIPDPDNHLTIDQIEALNFVNEFQIHYGSAGANSNIDLHLQSNLLDPVQGDLSLPSIVTNLRVSQHFVGLATLDDPGAIPQVRLDDITLELGSAIAKIVKPIVDQVNEFLAPIKSTILALDSDVPVLSDLSKKAGAGRLSWIDAIAAYSDDPDVATVVAAMHKVTDIVKKLSALADQANSIANAATAGIVFGDYIFSPTFDLRIPTPNGIDPTTAGSFVPRPGFLPTNNGTISSYVRNADSDPAVGNFLADELASDGFRFPIFESAGNIVPFLFGKDISIVTWHMPDFAQNSSRQIFSWESFPLVQCR